MNKRFIVPVIDIGDQTFYQSLLVYVIPVFIIWI